MLGIVSSGPPLLQIDTTNLAEQVKKSFRVRGHQVRYSQDGQYIDFTCHGCGHEFYLCVYYEAIDVCELYEKLGRFLFRLSGSITDEKFKTVSQA